MNNQLFFKFDDQVESSIGDVIVGSFNRSVMEYLFSDKWLANVVFIYGDKGVGKTTLAKAYTVQQKGYEINIRDLQDIPNIESMVKLHKVLLLEDIERLANTNELGLFNLYNYVVSLQGKLVMTSCLPLRKIHFTLKDLISRLQAAIIFEIIPPDDNSLRMIFVKMLTDKQLVIKKNVMEYLLARTPRHPQDMQKLVLQLDDIVMREKKTLSIPIIKQMLE